MVCEITIQYMTFSGNSSFIGTGATMPLYDVSYREQESTASV